MTHRHLLVGTVLLTYLRDTALCHHPGATIPRDISPFIGHY